MLPLALILLAAPGRPLFYWGARPATILADAPTARGVEALVTEVHAALDKGALVLRFTFDREVKEALYLRDGAPVSGRLRAALDIDTDGDRSTGFASGAGDLRTGADHRVEVGVVALGRDEEEKLEARALVTAALLGLAPDGRRRSLWRADDADNPQQVSIRGEWVELRLPLDKVPARAGSRLILLQGEKAYDGRLKP
jgi:hypothetical protein